MMVPWGWRAWLWLTVSAATSVSGQALSEEGARQFALPQCGHDQPRTQQQILTPQSEVRKRPAFHSWGGKRSSKRVTVGLPLNLREAYLTLFQHARSQPAPTEGELQRASFNPWGGKRPDPIFPAVLTSDFLNNPTKRNHLASWGGKLATGYFARNTSPKILKGDLIPYIPTLSEEGNTDADKWGSFAALGGDQGSFAIDGGNEEIWTEDEPSNLFLVDENLPIPAVDHIRYKREAESQSYAEALVKREDSHEKGEVESSKPVSRDNQSQEDIPSETKRVRFSAWAGKRLDLQAIQNVVRKWMEHKPKVAERRAFNAWAGKRSDKSLQNIQGKRAFSAWAGKRLNDNTEEQSLTKKTRFSPWADKQSEEITPKDGSSISRTSTDESFQSGTNDDLKRTFNAWAGKRSNSDDKQRAFNAWAGKQSNDDDKRQAFNAWAGKRSNSDEKRQAFNAWAGKRSNSDDKRQAFNAWAGKRSNDDDKRQAFNAWAGKRSNDDDKRQAFNAWAGKRSEADEKQAFSSWESRMNLQREDEVDARPEKRPTFGAWTGEQNDNWQDERDSQQISEILQHLHTQGQEIFHKRASSNSWGGNWVPTSSWEGERSNPISGDSQITDLVLTQL